MDPEGYDLRLKLIFIRFQIQLTIYDTPITQSAAFLKYLLRIDGAVPGAAFLVKKTKQFLQNFSVGRVTEAGMLPLDPGQAYILEFFEVVRERGTWNSKLRLDISDDHSFGVCRQEKPHDPEPWLRSHGGQHLGIARNISIFGFHDFLVIEKLVGYGHPALLSRSIQIPNSDRNMKVSLNPASCSP